MSLPSWGLLVKDDKVVGCGFCNPGWWLDNNGVKRCIKQTLESCEDFINERDNKKWKNENGVYWPIYHKYFTSTDEDVFNFDYIIVFEYKIPRKVALTLFMLGYTDEEWDYIMEKHVPLMDKEEYERLINCL